MATQAPDSYDYATARAAADAEYEAFRAAIPGRVEKAAREAAELLRAYGALPPGLNFELELQECP